MIDASAVHLSAGQLAIIVALIALAGSVVTGVLTYLAARTSATENRKVQERLIVTQRQIAVEERMFERRITFAEDLMQAASDLQNTVVQAKGEDALDPKKANEYATAFRDGWHAVDDLTGKSELYAPDAITRLIPKLAQAGMRGYVASLQHVVHEDAPVEDTTDVLVELDLTLASVIHDLREDLREMIGTSDRPWAKDRLSSA